MNATPTFSGTTPNLFIEDEVSGTNVMQNIAGLQQTLPSWLMNSRRSKHYTARVLRGIAKRKKLKAKGRRKG